MAASQVSKKSSVTHHAVSFTCVVQWFFRAPRRGAALLHFYCRFLERMNIAIHPPRNFPTYSFFFYSVFLKLFLTTHMLAMSDPQLSAELFNLTSLFIRVILTPILAVVNRSPLSPPRHAPAPPSDKEGPQCELLGPLALVIQCSMGALAILSLVVKRSYESPPRPWWIWFFDVSKQVFGALGLHMINLLLSILSSHSGEPDTDNNPCNWYFLNLLLDTTLGVPLLWFFLYIIHMTAFRIGITEIISGQYGEPPRWSAFIKQASLYLLGMVCMKSILYSVTQTVPWLDDLGEFLLSWTNRSPELQVVFVMLVSFNRLFPLDLY